MALAEIADVVSALGGTAGTGSSVFYGQTIVDATVQSALDSAETFIYNLAGTGRVQNLLSDLDLFVADLPKRACIAGACVGVLDGMLGNIMTEDFSVKTGSLSIDKSKFVDIVEKAIATWKERRDLFQRMLMEPMKVSPQGRTSPGAAGIPLSRDFGGFVGSPNSSRTGRA